MQQSSDLLISEAIKQFPEQFGLKAFPGKVFALSFSASYISEGQIYLYTVVQTDDGKWLSFCKGTPAELKSAMVRL